MSFLVIRVAFALVSLGGLLHHLLHQFYIKLHQNPIEFDNLCIHIVLLGIAENRAFQGFRNIFVKSS